MIPPDARTHAARCSPGIEKQNPLRPFQLGRQIMLGGAALLLVLAVGFQVLDTVREVPQPSSRERLARVVPTAESGWVGSDERLGATEVVNEAVLKTLNLDDYVYRRYENAGRTFTLYAAYWARGRMPTRLVASHTPDRCWTENGMRCVDMQFQKTYHLANKTLFPAEYRVFIPPAGSTQIYVAYWHTVEGRLYEYGRRFNAVPSPWLWWKDTIAQAAFGSREQLFVRIASSIPLDELWKDGGFQEVMTTVANLGLWDAEQPNRSNH